MHRRKVHAFPPCLVRPQNGTKSQQPPGAGKISDTKRESNNFSLSVFFFHHHQRLVETLTGTLAKKKREDRVKQTFARLNSLNGRLTVLSACRSDEKRDIIVVVVMESRPNPNVSSHLCSAEILLEIVSAFLHLIISYAEKRVGMAVCHLFKYGGSSCPSPPSCWWGRLESSSSFSSFFYICTRR